VGVAGGAEALMYSDAATQHDSVCCVCERFIESTGRKVDMNELAVRARIRRLNETGEIPCDERPPRLWAGPGTGDTCAVCTEPISLDETEFEVDLSSGLALRLHRRCYTLWLEECGALNGNA
jgi:hypothetical protein